MKRISTENAKPGQILAEKLQRHDGVLLAGQGAEITEGLLRMLSRMNVDTVVIEEENRLSPEEIEAIFTEKKAALEARFIRVSDQPVLMALKNTLVAMARKERNEALAAVAPPAETAAEGGPANAR